MLRRVICIAPVKPSHLKQHIIGTLQFKEEKLRVIYLRVPLIYGRLSFQDCKALIEKITTKINAWTAKHHSFAGRLQLIQSVLFSVQVFWAGIFILPKKVTAIENNLNRFLWQGQDNSTGGSKVS